MPRNRMNMSVRGPGRATVEDVRVAGHHRLVRPPAFQFDSHEKWFPVGVEESLAATGQTLSNPLQLNFPANLSPIVLPTVGYHRVQQGAGLWWHQFWLWYVDNPKVYAGHGRHEGDWEVVQLGCVDRDGEIPILVTASQHHTGAKRETWRCEHQGGRVVIYVARDSHANYLGRVHTVEDIADGRGRRLLDITWRPFGDWVHYRGRWGNSDTSPLSPARQRERWVTPHIWHGLAR